MKKKIEWFKYVATFLITAGLFFTVFYVTKVVNDSRLAAIRSIQDNLSIDLLSSDTQFSLLATAGCTADGGSILAPEIGQLGDHLSQMEAQLGTDNTDVVALKKYYSLLQIKDYILTKELATRCKIKPITVLYFYTNDCSDCTKQGYVLTALREQYPGLRIYSFDSNLDLSAIKTLQTINVISDTRPSIVVDGVTYAGFKSLDDIEKIIGPELKKLKPHSAVDSSTSSTSTQSVSTTGDVPLPN
jgi:hypothetical protein